MFDQLYDIVIKSKENAPFVDKDGKPQDTKFSFEASSMINDMMTEKALITIANVSEEVNENLLVSHLVMGTIDKYISICVLMDPNDLQNLKILVEADECVWDHFREKIGGYLYKDQLIKIDKPIYTQIDENFNMLRNIILDKKQ